ncbi:hypothetical protein R1flu_022355 [Riccia fluitans]|uniref:SKP1-like protein n=1 Tax=Riccia fluitans TaxID=41844 RepID=A0ABD1ZS10_9MARC
METPARSPDRSPPNLPREKSGLISNLGREGEISKRPRKFQLQASQQSNGARLISLVCLGSPCDSLSSALKGNMSNDTKVKLRSSDDEMFEVDEAVAYELLNNTIEDIGTDNPYSLLNVSSKILSKVIEYCKYHVENSKNRDDKPATPEDEIKLWDADFVKVDQATLFDLILAANFLNIKNLLDLTCQTAADMIKGKTPEEIRKTFNIN